MGVHYIEYYRCKRCSKEHSFGYGGFVAMDGYKEMLICDKTVNGKKVYCDWESV